MIERVARAIWDMEFEVSDVAHQCRGDEWVAYVSHARAAIEAMRSEIIAKWPKARHTRQSAKLSTF